MISLGMQNVLGFKTSGFVHTVRQKTEKTITILATILRATSFSDNYLTVYCVVKFDGKIFIVNATLKMLTMFGFVIGFPANFTKRRDI